MPERSYEVQLSASAARSFRKLDQSTRMKLGRVIDSLALNPRPIGVKKLESASHIYRIRSGDYRIIYEIRDRLLTILVVSIGHRRDIYR